MGTRPIRRATVYTPAEQHKRAKGAAEAAIRHATNNTGVQPPDAETSLYRGLTLIALLQAEVKRRAWNGQQDIGPMIAAMAAALGTAPDAAKVAVEVLREPDTDYHQPGRNPTWLETHDPGLADMIEARIGWAERAEHLIAREPEGGWRIAATDEHGSDEEALFRIERP